MKEMRKKIHGRNTTRTKIQEVYSAHKPVVDNFHLWSTNDNI